MFGCISKNLKLISTLLACIACLHTIALAQYISPELVQITTPVYKPDFSEFKPQLGTYKYEISWQGIPAAEAVIKLELVNDQFRVTANARTYSPINIFYNLNYNAAGLLSLADFSPIHTTVYHQENSRIKNTDIKFLENGDILAVRSQNNEEPPKVVHFNSNNFTLEPFSAALIARSLNWQEGQSREFDAFNGKTRYLVTLTAKEKSLVSTESGEKEVWGIEPTVKNLSDQKANGKLKHATIYVTTDRSHDIVKISSKVFIGTVNTKLKEFVPISQQASTVLARELNLK